MNFPVRFIAFIILFLIAAPVWAAESPVVTGDPGTAGANAAPESNPDESPKRRWVIQMPQDITPEAAQRASSLATEPEPPIQPHEVPAEQPAALTIAAPPPTDLIAPAKVIPEGVRYTVASEAGNTRAYHKITAALSETPHDFRSLMPVGGETTSYTGVFMAMYDLEGQKEKTKLLNTVTYKILFSDLVTKEVIGYGAKTAQQLEMMAAAYMENIKIAPGYKIRKMTPEEMAISWHSSSRDIFEPAFVVEDGAHKYVFHMSHDGETLDFFEDLGHPCFPAMGSPTRMENGVEIENENYMPCKCFGTSQEGLKYTVIFQSCKSKE